MRLIAHRGAGAQTPGNPPENTTRAFLAGLLDEGADGIECDVRLLGDGTPVVFHDRDTRALCGAGGPLEAMSLAEFGALRLDGEPLATLAEVRAAVGPVGRTRPIVWNVELKPTARPRELVTAALAALAPLAPHPGVGSDGGLGGDSGVENGVDSGVAILFSSFDPRTLMDLQGRGWGPAVALLFEDPQALTALAFLDLRRLDLHPHKDLVDIRSITRWHEAGHRVRAWTVDDAAEARRLRELGVDAIITNRPGPLRRELATLTP